MLREAVDVPALSPGWQQSFAELLAAHENSTGATPPPMGVEPGWSGFRTLRVAEIRRESSAVLSIELEATDGAMLPVPRPGQYLTLRIPAGDPAPLRSYSLSSGGARTRYRISVKREEHGRVSRWLHANVRAGTVIEAAAPRGDFYLGDEAAPVVLVSAGIGITPVLAMLHALAANASEREIWWLHITRDPQSLAFGGEVSELIESLANARQRVFYTAQVGRPDASAIAALGLPREAIAYLCGPEQFMARDAQRTGRRGDRPGPDSQRIVRRATADQSRYHEYAAPDAALARRASPEPGRRFRSRAAGSPSTGRRTTTAFSSSPRPAMSPPGSPAAAAYATSASLPLVDGAVIYAQQPLELPADGSVLICSAQPCEGVVLDL